MPTTVIAANTTPGKYSTTGQALTFTAADTVNGNHIIATSNCILYVYNDGVGTPTVTITSVADDTFGRTGDVSAQALSAGEIRTFRLTKTGWANSSGEIAISGSTTDVKFAWQDLNVTT